MDRDDYTDPSYTQPHVPPATPPVIDHNADARDAATRAMRNGDSDSSGSRPGSFPRGAEDEELQRHDAAHESEPGEGGDTIDPQSPDELDPDGGDSIDPQSPDEFDPDGGDIVEPGATPGEIEPAAPPETLLPPD